MKNKKNLGFTVIELLIVIAIIGLLSAVILGSLNTARKKSRDAKRISDIRQIQTALEMFYDKNRYYPQSGSCAATIPNAGWCNSVQSILGNSWIRNGAAINLSEFLLADPKDPINQLNWPRNAYYYYANGYGSNTPLSQWYMIVYALEIYPNRMIENSDGVKAPNGTNFHYGNNTNGIITVGVNSQN